MQVVRTAMNADVKARVETRPYPVPAQGREAGDLAAETDSASLIEIGLCYRVHAPADRLENAVGSCLVDHVRCRPEGHEGAPRGYSARHEHEAEDARVIVDHGLSVAAPV